MRSPVWPIWSRVRAPAEAGHDARAADGAAEQAREVLELPERRPRADPAATADHDLGIGQRDAARRLRLRGRPPARPGPRARSSDRSVVTVGAGALRRRRSTATACGATVSRRTGASQRGVLEEAAGPALADDPPGSPRGPLRARPRRRSRPSARRRERPRARAPRCPARCRPRRRPPGAGLSMTLADRRGPRRRRVVVEAARPSATCASPTPCRAEPRRGGLSAGPEQHRVERHRRARPRAARERERLQREPVRLAADVLDEHEDGAAHRARRPSRRSSRRTPSLEQVDDRGRRLGSVARSPRRRSAPPRGAAAAASSGRARRRPCRRVLPRPEPQRARWRGAERDPLDLLLLRPQPPRHGRVARKVQALLHAEDRGQRQRRTSPSRRRAPRAARRPPGGRRGTRSP